MMNTQAINKHKKKRSRSRDKNLTASQYHKTTLLESKHNLRLCEMASGTCSSVKSSSHDTPKWLETPGTVSSFVFLNWKGGLRKNKTWKGFRRDSKMIGRIKNKTSEERWKELELFAAFKRGGDVTINNLTDRMVAFLNLKTEYTKPKQWEKRWWLSQAPASRHATHSYTTPFISLKFTYSYYLCFLKIFLLFPADSSHVRPYAKQ